MYLLFVAGSEIWHFEGRLAAKFVAFGTYFAKSASTQSGSAWRPGWSVSHGRVRRGATAGHQAHHPCRQLGRDEGSLFPRGAYLFRDNRAGRSPPARLSSPDFHGAINSGTARRAPLR